MARRLFLARLFVVLVLVAGAVTVTAEQHASAQEAPDAAASPPPVRYFGRGAYDAIVAAANSVATTCDISTQGRVALMLAPVFKESSNATSPSEAPSPMTLSRYDEWNGTRNGDTNRNANYGLYAFEDPESAYPRAYWHPGIGIWQYDSAGVGAPYTAVERMDTGIVGKDVASGMFSRYCNELARSLAAGDTVEVAGQNARHAAWAPWGRPCGLCQQAFDHLAKHRDPGKPSGFRYLELVDGIESLGGAQPRTCTIDGGSRFPCWYVDPARAQGANWWTRNPNDSNPRGGMAPLSHPFYVYESGGREYRHWLRADTRYPIDISARRTLGRNARPRTNQSGSGLTWSNRSGLCDVSAHRGHCGTDPIPPAELRSSLHVVNGTTYRPMTGDFNGDGLSDILWYAPGNTPDYVWWSNRNGGFTSTAVTVGGDYRPQVGDLDGNGVDDVLWYNGTSSHVWLGSRNGRFTSHRVSLPSNRTVLLADFGGTGQHNVLVYGPGTASDHILTWSNGRFATRTIVVNGHYQPFVGDFDGRGGDDIFWYAPGPAPDSIWWSSGNGGFTSTSVTVNGTFRPLVGDFDGDGADDIMWYAPGATPDHTWFGNRNRSFASRSTPVGGNYRPIVADLDNDGRDDIFWYAPGSTPDHWWRYTSGRRVSSTPVPIKGSFVPVTGTFGSGRDGIFWYGPGATADVLWYR